MISIFFIHDWWDMGGGTSDKNEQLNYSAICLGMPVCWCIAKA